MCQMTPMRRSASGREGWTARDPLLLDRVLQESRGTGNLIHDAHLVARALEHGVHEILTLDGDFARLPQIASRNPFLT